MDIQCSYIRDICLAKAIDCLPRFNFFGNSLIAPSRNILNMNILKERNNVDPSFLKNRVVPFSGKYGLSCSHTLEPIPLANHCVAMTLHYLLQYRKEKNIQLVAKQMSAGANEECAKTTILYRALIKENFNSPLIESEAQFLSDIRTSVAQSLGLDFYQEWKLIQVPVENMFDFLNEKLPKGEYVISLPNHLVALVKDEVGGMYLYDPNRGTFDLNKNKNKFYQFLLKYNIHLNETLSLFRIQKYDSEQAHSNQVFEIRPEIDEPLANLTFEKQNGRWETAIFTWRGITHRFVKDQLTNMIYNGDSKKLIRFKCIILSIKTPIAAIIRTVYHVAVALLHVLALPLMSSSRRKKEIEQIKNACANVFRVPFYEILATCSALYGIFKPYDGRRLYSYFERCMNQQNRIVARRKKYYCAPCFIPLNFNAKNKKDLENNTVHLKRAVLWKKHAKGKFLEVIAKLKYPDF